MLFQNAVNGDLEHEQVVVRDCTNKSEVLEITDISKSTPTGISTGILEIPVEFLDFLQEPSEQKPSCQSSSSSCQSSSSEVFVRKSVIQRLSSADNQHKKSEFQSQSTSISMNQSQVNLNFKKGKFSIPVHYKVPNIHS